jgi:hypothetical protein
VPGEETVFGGEARDSEDLHCLAGQEWCQHFGGDAWIGQRDSREPDGLTPIIAERAVRADELADPKSASEAVMWNRQHVASPFWREGRVPEGTRFPARSSGVRRGEAQSVDDWMREAVNDGRMRVKRDDVAHRTHLR